MNIILEMLKELLIEYQRKFEDNQKECIELMRAGKEWRGKAREGASIKMMIEVTILEMKAYNK